MSVTAGLLDREMSDAELSFRSEEDYVSKYRRVLLEHFDALKIGLTATPALHTTQIFGNRSSPTPTAKPLRIMTRSFRERHPFQTRRGIVAL